VTWRDQSQSCRRLQNLQDTKIRIVVRAERSCQGCKDCAGNLSRASEYLQIDVNNELSIISKLPQSSKGVIPMLVWGS